MVQVTNNTNDVLDFHKKGATVKDGIMPTESIAARETKDIDVDVEDPTVKGYAFAGAITIQSGRHSAPRAKSAE